MPKATIIRMIPKAMLSSSSPLMVSSAMAVVMVRVKPLMLPPNIRAIVQDTPTRPDPEKRTGGLVWPPDARTIARTIPARLGYCNNASRLSSSPFSSSFFSPVGCSASALVSSEVLGGREAMTLKSTSFCSLT